MLWMTRLMTSYDVESPAARSAAGVLPGGWEAAVCSTAGPSRRYGFYYLILFYRKVLYVWG